MNPSKLIHSLLPALALSSLFALAPAGASAADKADTLVHYVLNSVEI